MIINMVNKLVDEKMEENADMAKKNRFPHVDTSMEIKSKEEILDMSNETQSQVAVGFQEMTNNDDADMIQQEMELVKEMESKSDKIWDMGGKDGVIGDSVGDDENEKSVMSDEELKQKMRERNMGNVLNMSDMPTLSNKIKKAEFEWEFDKCTPIHRFGKIHKWQTVMSAEMIADLYLNGTVYYDFNVQRGSKKTNQGTLKPLITPSEVNSILQKMLDNRIAGGALTFCYFKENEEELDFDEENNCILKGKNKLAVIDGAHRVFSCIKMKKLNKKDPVNNPSPSLFEYPVFIEYLDIPSGMDLFREYANAGRKIGKVRVEALSVFDPFHHIAEEIIKTSELHNKVEKINSSPKDNNIILFSTLMNGIRIFKPQTQKDSIEVLKFLAEFWSELIYLFKDQMGNMEFKQRQEIRKQTFLLEPMFLNGMFHVAKYLMDYPNDWVNKLKKLKEDPNFFSRGNKIWRNIMREGGATIHTSATQKIVIDAMVNQVR